MALFPDRHPLLRQPSHLARIRERHWLARDLVFAHSGISAFVFNAPAQARAELTRAVVREGSRNANLAHAFGFVPDGSNAVEYELPIPLSLPLTLSAWSSSSSSNSTEALLSVRRSLGSNGGIRLSRGFSGAGAAVTTFDTSGGFNSATISPAYTTGAWRHYCGWVETSTSRRITSDGGSGVTDTGSRTFPSNCTVVSIGRSANSANTVATAVTYGICLPLVISRVLDDGEIARLHEEQRSNPWDLFTERPIWVPVSSGGGYTHPTLSNARMGSLTTTGGVPLVDYTF